MKQLLYQSQYYEILFDEAQSLIIHKALPDTLAMSNEHFKHEMTVFLEMCEKHRPERDLVDLIDMRYVILPDMQEWVNMEIFPTLLATIKRMAFVVPVGIFETLALEQTMDEEYGKKFVRRYFKDEGKALEWLMAN
ncbi:hypothetical protein [Rhodoflexus sp.]